MRMTPLMSKHLHIVVIALVLLLLNSSNDGQGRRELVDERNVRAQMNFLAGDAMQGRGSGTIFERIAAEYVGSQFMQFGLEPAGDTGPDGRSTYVQSVSIQRGTFSGKPSIKYGDTTLEHGREMVVLHTTAGEVSGPLQKIETGKRAQAGSAVLLTLSPGGDPKLLQEAVPSLLADGAAIVLVEETPELRQHWDLLGGRDVTFAGSGKPSVIAGVSKEAAAALSRIDDGTRISFGGGQTVTTTLQTWNAVGKITGSDREFSSQVILLTSHLDHLGVRANGPGPDNIFNGADDDASGTVAVLELARVLAQGKKPRRTVYFVCFGSEESGGRGATHFVNNLPFPQDKLIANLEFEMIGRPDIKVKPGELWLTGYDLSDLGPELARRGAKLVADPHPSENFFQRSDNYTLAKKGVIAHTVSSYGLHSDYHQVTDDPETIDFAHMTRSITSMVAPVRWLVNSTFAPAWHPGKKP